MKNWFLKRTLFVKALIIIAAIGTVWLGSRLLFPSTAAKVQYVTATAQRGTLIVSVSGSGQVSTANSAPVYTQASGVVATLHVKEGDMVTAGDKIAEIELDLSGKQNSAQAWSNYQSAQNNLNNAQASLYTLRSSMYANWDTYNNITQDGKYTNSDGSYNNDNRLLPEFIESQDNWLAAEAKYKNQQGVVNQAQTSLNAAWLAYQLDSPTIYAPISGQITGFSLQVGSVISASSSQSSTTQTNTKIASVKTTAAPTITINLTEIDVTKVKEGNKATVTLDAFAGKTFTGKIVSIDTSGQTTSGVTTYPAVIQLDTQEPSMLSNMSAQASIITDIKNDVITVPSAAVRTTNEQLTVQVMKNGKPQSVTVTTGASSSTDTEILTGISENDVVVTSTTSTATTSSSSTRSVFSSFGGGGGATRISR